MVTLFFILALLAVAGYVRSGVVLWRQHREYELFRWELRLLARVGIRHQPPHSYLIVEYRPALGFYGGPS